jgi:hypothetical protein
MAVSIPRAFRDPFLLSKPGVALPVNTEVVAAYAAKDAIRPDPGLSYFFLTPMYRLVQHNGYALTMDLVAQFLHEEGVSQDTRRVFKLQYPFATLPLAYPQIDSDVLEAVPHDLGDKFAGWLSAFCPRIHDPETGTNNMFSTEVVIQKYPLFGSGTLVDVFAAMPRCSGARAKLTGEPPTLRVIVVGRKVNENG